MNRHFVQHRIRTSGTPLGRRFAVVIVMVIGLTSETFAVTETVLLRFDGGKGGARPLATLVFDKAGNLYGTTAAGGAPAYNGTPQGCGVVFQLKAKTNGFAGEDVLYAFKGGSDGCYPQAGVNFDAAGNLYGTTAAGGSSGNGTVFELTHSPAGWTEKVLYSFGGSGDGIGPSAPVIFDAAGNLYGTTSGGGTSGNGTVFELTPSPTGWTETVLYSFNCNYEFCLPSGVVLDASGNLYATTYWGGVYGTGAVYEIVRSGNFWSGETLYSFTGGSDGGWPISGVILDSSGNLHGTTFAGGAYGWGARGGGTVFELSLSETSWTESVLYSFQYPATPIAGLTFQGTRLYGTTSEGGPANAGSVFQLTPSGSSWTEKVLYSFAPPSNGASPEAAVIFDTSGNLYGTTYYGGNPQDDGTVFEVVIVAPTTTRLSSSLNPSTYGQAVTFTAAVTSSVGAPPDGEIVAFMKGTTVLGTGTLSGGSASFTTSTLPAGTNTIDAVYRGDSNFGGSTSMAVRQVVNRYATSTALASSLNPSIYGQSVTWTATVTTSGPIAPTGKVNFTWGDSIGTATLNANGVATLTRSNLNADSYPLTAVYSGDANNARSTSAILNQVVTETTSAATISSSPNPSTQGQAVTFTATITSPTVKPTGPVTFTAGKTVLGTAQLSSGKAKFTTSTLAVGKTTVKATYYGDSNIAESSASVTQTVQ